MSLKMYFNGSDWVIAESPAAAMELFLEFIGYECDDDEEMVWDELPMDKVLSLWCYPDGRVAPPDEDGATLVDTTVAEEIAKLGRRYVGSADY